MIKQRTQERVTLGLVLALFVAAAVNFSLFYVRFDLTSSGTFTISQASKATVGQAKENIYLTYYLTKDLKGLSPLPQSIEDFLFEYASGTGGKIKVSVVDPVDAKIVEQVERLGIQPNPMQVVKENENKQTIVYSGLVLQYLGKQEVLPLVFQTESLEYDLTSKISKLITNKTRTVGILIGDHSKTLENSYTLLSKTLGENGVFRVVTSGEPLDPALSVLIVAGSKDLTDYDAYEVDQYLMKGGRVLFAIDGVLVDIADQTGKPAVSGLEQSLVKLLKNYGVQFEAALVNDTYNRLVQFSTPRGPVLMNYTLWPQIVAPDTSKTHPVTSHFPGLDLMWASPVEVLPQDGIKAEPLVWSSPKSWLMKEPLTIDPQMATYSAQNHPETVKSHHLVWSLTGIFTSPYNASNLPRRLGEPAAAVSSPVPKSPETRVMVIGDSDFLSDMMQVSNSPYNAVFADNCADWLAQDDALLSIKSRPYREKSLSQLKDAESRKTAGFLLSFVNLCIVPLVVIGFALLRFVSRRQREIQGNGVKE